MAGEKFIALEETSQEIKTTVNDVKTNVDGLKNTDVPGIDTLVNAVLERIGQAGDTVDSGTAGTVMDKLNEIINKLAQTGVNVSTTGFGKTAFEYANEIAVELGYQRVFAKFIAPVSGIYNVSFDAAYTKSGYSGRINLYKVPDFRQLIYYASSNSGYKLIEKPYDKLAISNELIAGDPISGNTYTSFRRMVEDLIPPVAVTITDTYARYNAQIHCYKGELVFIYADGYTQSYYSRAKNIVITYGND